MATGREIYERAIALVDEINEDTGEVDVDTTMDYLARAPYLLTMLQTELMPLSNTRNKFVIEADGDGKGWVKADLPIDVMEIEDVIIERESYLHDPSWKSEKNGNITEFYYHSSVKGEIRISYVPIPVPVTDLDEDLTIDDTTANMMAYGLAEAFINVEQNDFLQAIFKRKYDEQKAMLLANKPRGFTRIVDVYGGI